MVDSIDKIGSQNIDWYKLTVKEVKQYQSEGIEDEIPSEVRKWVEEMAKVANAPDNVTYEMAKSGAVTTMNPQDNPEGTTGNTQVDQGILLGEQSDLAADEVESLMAEIEDWTANAAAANSEAQNAYDGAMGRINALHAELTSATASRDKAKASSINEQLAAAGQNAQGLIGGFAAQINAMRNNVTGLMATAQNAINLGNQAVEIGNIETAAGNATSAVETFVQQGTNAITVGNNGLDGTAGADIDTASFGQNVRAYVSDIQQSTGASVTVQGDDQTQPATTENETENNTDKTEETPPNNTTGQPQTEDDVTDKVTEGLADEDITTDPLEILKRKQKRGEA